ncbi:MAG: porin [Deltaproteobacteria bacterium]|nr:porin [Deltaproteobacteria bacterium]
MLKKKMQLSFVVLALTAAVLFAISPANAVDFKISGQINRLAMYANDSETSKWFFADNANSSTRFRFTGSEKFEKGWKVGILWEVEMKSNPANEVSMDNDDDTGDVDFNERHINFWIQKQNWGTMSLGQGDSASNGTSEVDLSGTDVAAYSSVDDIGGNFEFRDGDDKLGVTVGESRSNFDGFSRKDRIRYDTPTWAGFFASASVMLKNRWDIAGRYSADFDWAKFAAAAAYSDYGTTNNDRDKDWQASSSASILFDFGLNLSAAYAYQDAEDDNPWNLFGKIGYKFLEKHAASVQYSRTENRSADDDKGDTFGAAYVFSPWQSVELYGTYYLHMLEVDDGDDGDDIHIGVIGGRVKF